jgi:hypothetical protein
MLEMFYLFHGQANVAVVHVEKAFELFFSISTILSVDVCVRSLGSYNLISFSDSTVLPRQLMSCFVIKSGFLGLLLQVSRLQQVGISFFANPSSSIHVILNA